MAKRALVIGSQTGGLQGPIGDAEQMEHLLRETGFLVDIRTTAMGASREGILDGYRQLIERTQLHDTVVIYYSGHGVRVLPTAGAYGAVPSSLQPKQAIVPMDFDESTPGDFRGITDVELSVLLAQLTRRTPNATVILDCCHSAALSRDPMVRIKGLGHPSFVEIQAHLERVTANGLDVGILAAAGNPHAVRLVAAGQSQNAYERYIGDRAVGTFTESLLLALREASRARVTWDMVIRAVRERVLALHPDQRADAEGPRRRYVFDEDEAPHGDALTIVPGDGPREAILRGGRIHGIHVGDEYAVLASGASATHGLRLATATVTQVDASNAAVALAFVPPASALPAGAQAYPISFAAPKRTVQLIATGHERAAIATAIERNGRFSLIDGEAPRGSHTGGAELLATVEVRDGQIELRRPSGLAIVPPLALSDTSIQRTVTNLAMISAAQQLDELASGSEELPEHAIDVTWGRVEHGVRVPLAMHGELLGIGDQLYVSITNQHPYRKRLFVHVFDVGVALRILRLTSSWPAGYELEAGATFTLGETANHRLRGLVLGWSKELPHDVVRTESLVVIVTERPADLSVLETPGAVHHQVQTRGEDSPLAQRLRQMQHGTRRVIPKDIGARATDDYLVRRISFELSPWPLPRTTQGDHRYEFLCDDSPLSSARAGVRRGPPRRSGEPRGSGTPRGSATVRPDERTIALRIAELAIHDTRSWFSSSDIRVDTLVITRAAANGVEPYRAGTWRFDGIADGERLPIQNALVFHGPVRDFVDFRIWVSRDREDSKSLSELLKDQLNAPEFQQAATALVTASTAGIAAAPIVAAIGATSTLTTIAWRVLSQALPRSIGLYQTSLLAGEGAGFGQGFHPANGALRAQGFSLRYEVALVDRAGD